MEGDLSARSSPVRGTHDEIDQLVSSLNAMLSRIQQLDGRTAFQVSSDIAHDLRIAASAAACASISRMRAGTGDQHRRLRHRDRRRHRGGAGTSFWRPSPPCCASPRSRPARRNALFAEIDLSEELAKSVGEAYQPWPPRIPEHTLDCQIDETAFT